MKDVQGLFVKAETTINETMSVIQEKGVGIALIVDDDKKLVHTVTDGDIRRAILLHIPLTAPVSALIEHKTKEFLTPVVASVGTPHEELLDIMNDKVINQIPLLDDEGRVVEVILLSELVSEELNLPLDAVVMAGGKGQRLLPLTRDIPKPMLPIEDKPMMERLIEQLRVSGIKQIYISTNYKADVIQKHFGHGDKHSVSIDYLEEKSPLGTAGALSLMDKQDKPLLVVNGDIITQLDYRAMFHFHKHYKAVMTIGVRKYDIKIPYGVIETEGVEVKGLSEKPVLTNIVNAGVYILEPSAYKFIPKNQQFHMTDLVNCLLNEGLKVISCPIQEYWLDVGQPQDYRKAQEDISNGKYSNNE